MLDTTCEYGGRKALAHNKLIKGAEIKQKIIFFFAGK